jgi:flavorubredoxin
MKALVAYESMYGNTARIAGAIGRGLAERGFEVEVKPFGRTEPALAAGVDLLVVGGPTHMHGMSRDATRAAAAKDAKNPYEHPTVTPGIRTWLDGLPQGNRRRAAAFDTRLDARVTFTGSAAKGIGHQLRRHGFELTVPPESFLVTKTNTLLPEEEARARDWALAIASSCGSAVPSRGSHDLASSSISSR